MNFYGKLVDQTLSAIYDGLFHIGGNHPWYMSTISNLCCEKAHIIKGKLMTCFI